MALLGTGGTIPRPNRWLASALIRYAGHLVLFDCGEGTQISLQALGWGLKAIDLILISHVHGDHVAGLPGLLSTLGNSGRRQPVDVVGAAGFTRVVEGLLLAAGHLPFEVRCKEVGSGIALQIDRLIVTAAEADHSVPCLAFRLELPRAGRFDPVRANNLAVPKSLWRQLQAGATVAVGDQVYSADQVMGPPRRSVSLGLVTDTRPTAEIANLVRGADLLVCEGTFGSALDSDRAVQRKHMTFAEAALLARSAAVRRLVLTHFGAALTRPDEFAEEAVAIFPATEIGRDHAAFDLVFRDDEDRTSPLVEECAGSECDR